MPASVRKRFTEGVENLTRGIAKRLKELGRPAPDRLAASMVAEMMGAVALSRAIDDPAASDRILKTSREALKARIGLT
jgi:TetR/AcrR family transcriptional repressor of nem operon